MQKIYCYVDETGQDTKGALFLVALVMVTKERGDLRKLLRQIEKRSGKTNRKWKHTTISQRLAYLQEVINERKFHGKLFFQEFTNTAEYLTCTVAAIAAGINRGAFQQYKVIILIDGLGKKERKIVGARLRARHIHTEKVRGVRDETDEFIRLADALAGFIRDAREGQAYAQRLYTRILSEGIVIQL